ncbi:hypothetical protein phiKDA1_15 (endogenous virus) [Enterobacter phage phiKDA1]|uniref:Uncharacterized protein n=1 Tax=Enterobacter phage phiKDA1 TaxID=1147139 RepID=A0A0A6Z596_9CAUD|nr:hypothetical protein HOQ86_gp16 [Enterobacter phage phiKDA1]AFE86108.1 hypothetical protein phiKDA1_15 [Enterobacter phage phiKDA1]
MHKILDRNELFEGFAVPEWATAATYFKGQWYFEESLQQLDGNRFELVGSGHTRKYGGGAIKGFETSVLFTPLIEQDDPLPPAPESGVYYSHNNDRRVTVLLEDGLPEDVIAVGTDASFMKVRLTADTALVLAHDLTRMAMEIKRKEKRRG